MLIPELQKIIDSTITKLNTLVEDSNYNSATIVTILENSINEIQNLKPSSHSDSVKWGGRIRIPNRIPTNPGDIIPVPTPEEIAEKLKKAAEDKIRKSVDDAFNNIKNQIPDINQEKQNMLNKLEEIKNQFTDFLNVNTLIEKAINEAEKLCEEYLKSKLSSIEQAIPVISYPDVELKLNGKTLHCNVLVYFVEANYQGNAPQNDFIVKIEVTLEQSISNLSPPDIKIEPQFGNVDDRIRQEIENQKQALIQGMITALFSDYLTVFNKFREIADI
ncbi:peptidylprolyl isomerase [Bacillus cereus Rock1-15]|uniref:hypothetical protein n=1 Tax=Bacillus cereus TaxID=1396 RepID=UPI0001A06ECF|nr:hypothetical protein [Bacillus cereus]EEL25230.1 peptidylprolyl isomerase [Bacillus cereus Rock1-15]